LPSREVGGLSGRVTRVERSADQIRIDAGRGQLVRVDLSHATDANGAPIHARDIQAGDQVSMTGTYNNEIYMAATVRLMNAEPGTVEVRPGESAAAFDLGLVTIYATVQTTLASSPQIVLRDTNSGNRLRVYAADDLVVRTKSGGYTTADRLREGDAVVVKAYRDADGNYIAQTIRMR
jgi:Ribonuclease G/E